MAPVCSKCGSKDIETEDSHAVCVNCGHVSFAVFSSLVIRIKCLQVISEVNITSDITFSEGGDGSTNVVGQFVSDSGIAQRIYGRSIPPMRQARELTLSNGKKHITSISGMLQLKQHHIDAAQRLLSLAANRNFTQGRKIQNVAAACLYVVCRRQKTHHMLIDFSDILQTNLFVLGNTFLKLCKLLNIKPPVIDPSLYIHRFAAQLEFEEMELAVANTALRLVQRMKRDWIQTGRRPSGICGAALLIAARIHKFRRTQEDIIRVVKICDVTLRNRLYEFEYTPSSSLTLEQLEAINDDDTEECDPPVLIKARQKEKERREKRKAEEQVPVVEEAPIFGKRVKWTEEYDDGNDVLEEGVEKERPEGEEIEEQLEKTLRGPDVEKLTSMTPEEVNKPLEIIPGAPNVEVEEESDKEIEVIEESLSDVDSVDLEMYINTEEEMLAKKAIWDQMNIEYLKELEENEKLNAEKEEKEEKPKVVRKRTPKPKEIAESPAEAVSNILQKKVEKSAKVNYSMVNMNSLFKGVEEDF